MTELLAEFFSALSRFQTEYSSCCASKGNSP
jgi:hypothetical protein